MRGRVFVKNAQDYEKWLGEQETFSDLIAKQKIIDSNEIKLVKNNLND